MSRRGEPEEKSLVRFFVQSGRLKREKRKGWVKKLGMAHPESVADHSYRTALMAMVVSDSRGLDTCKAMRLALLHDLPEALVGDTMPGERSAKSKVAGETKAFAQLAKGLPGGLRTKYQDAWDEYVDGKSEEAKLVRQLDKLEMAIQAWEYVRDSADPAKAREFSASARSHMADEGLLRLLGLVEF